jgi:hypothetical protein
MLVFDKYFIENKKSKLYLIISAGAESPNSNNVNNPPPPPPQTPLYDK